MCSVSVPIEFNSESLDLQSVTEIWLKLKGTAVAQGHKGKHTEDTKTALAARKGKMVKTSLRTQDSQPENAWFKRSDVEKVMSRKLSRKSSPWQMLQCKGFGSKAAQEQTSVQHYLRNPAQDKKTRLHSAEKGSEAKTGFGGPKKAFLDKNSGNGGAKNTAHHQMFRQGLGFQGKAKGQERDVKKKLSREKCPRIVFQGKSRAK